FSARADTDYFEGFSFTAGVSGCYTVNQFDYIPVTDPSLPAYYDTTYDLAIDQSTSWAGGADIAVAYNFSRYFIGVAAFGLRPGRAEGGYTVREYSSYSGQSSTLEKGTYYIDQYLGGALFEIGFCRSTITFVDYSSMDLDANKHFAIGFGPYCRKVKSDLSDLDGTTYGWVWSLRWQRLIIGNAGLELGMKWFDPYGDQSIIGFHAGLFYKLI
ncbi:MAG: hypothetical protein ACRCUT_03780, partial [Spirochaetota bacterium]